MEVGGASVPGARVSPSDVITVGAEGGIYLSPAISLSLVFGLPPRTDLNAGGSIAAAGRLGRDRFGLISLLGAYHFTGLGRFQPYVAAGPVFAPTFSTEDGAAQNVSVDNAWGGAVQVGFDYMVTDHAGFFLNATQNIIGTSARARFAGTPVTVKSTLDPFIAQTGLVLRF